MISFTALTFLVSAAHANHHNKNNDPANICEKDPDFCAANSVSEPVRSCTEGFAYDEVLECCVSEVVYEPLMRCPNGGAPLADGTCDIESYPRVSCPAGYTYDTVELQCVLTDRTPMVPTCAHMPELGGTLTPDGRQCEYFKAMESRPNCPKGAKYRDGACVMLETVKGPEDLTFSCPDGWSLDLGTRECVVVERVDCNAGAAKVKEARPCKLPKVEECPFESFRACDEDCVVPEPSTRMLCDGKKCREKVRPEHACQATSACKMALRERPRAAETTSFVEPVVCERVTKLPAVADCPDGAVYNARTDTCCTESKFEPEAVCTGGQIPDQFGNCPKLMHYTADYVCPEPFVVSCNTRAAQRRYDNRNLAHPGNCECVSLTMAPSTPVCPEGSILDEVTNMCLSNVMAEVYCPEADAVLGADGLCVRTEHEPVRLEYTVLYVTEKPCELDECVRERVPIKKRTVTHKEVSWSRGKPRTRCHHTRCTNINGDVITEPDSSGFEDFVPPAIPDF